MKLPKILGLTFLVFLFLTGLACQPASTSSDDPADPADPATVADPADPADPAAAGPTESPADETAPADETVTETLVEPVEEETTETADENESGGLIIGDENRQHVDPYGPDLQATAMYHLPDGWPDDVPVMSGYEFAGAVDGASMGQDFIQVQSFGNVEWPSVERYYSNLPGWSLTDDFSVDDMPNNGQAIVLKNDSSYLTVMWGDPGPGQTIPDGNKYFLTLLSNPQ